MLKLHETRKWSLIKVQLNNTLNNCRKRIDNHVMMAYKLHVFSLAFSTHLKSTSRAGLCLMTQNFIWLGCHGISALVVRYQNGLYPVANVDGLGNNCTGAKCAVKYSVCSNCIVSWIQFVHCTVIMGYQTSVM